jgi:hypothetical protein
LTATSRSMSWSCPRHTRPRPPARRVPPKHTDHPPSSPSHQTYANSRDVELPPVSRTPWPKRARGDLAGRLMRRQQAGHDLQS